MEGQGAWGFVATLAGFCPQQFRSLSWVWAEASRGHSRPLKQLSPGTLTMHKPNRHFSCFFLRGILGPSNDPPAVFSPRHSSSGFLWVPQHPVLGLVASHPPPFTWQAPTSFQGASGSFLPPATLQASHKHPKSPPPSSSH